MSDEGDRRPDVACRSDDAKRADRAMPMGGEPRVTDRETLVETLEGCVTEETRRADVPSMTPADLKADWTADLPGDG